jgi:elongin-A
MPSTSSVESSIKQIPFRSIASTTPSNITPLKASLPGKKDPMASLFVPKHRAYSQRLS